MTAADLARLTAHDKTAISRAVADLDREDPVIARADPDPGRRKILV